MRGNAAAAFLALLAACAAPAPPAPITFVPEAETPPPRAEVRTSTAAARELELSIERAALMALENSRDLRVEAFEPVIAGTFEYIERGVFDPELFSRFRFLQERGSQVARATGERFDVEGQSSDAVVGLRQRLPTGTTLEATVEHGLEDSDRTPQQQVARLGLTITQSLLRGFGPAVNLAAVRQAELEFDASVYELTGFAEALLANAEIAYWRFVLAKEEIAIFERSLAVAEQEQVNIEERIAVGMLPELEVAAARAEVARRTQALIDARSRLEEARLNLVRILSPTPDGRLDVAVVATSDPRLEPRSIDDVEDRVRLAEKTRPDLNEAILRMKQRRVETVVTKNGVLPRLDVFVALGKAGFGDSFGGAVTGIGEDTYDVVAGLDLSTVLGQRATGAVDRAARASHAQATAAVENLRQLIRLEVRLAANEVRRAREQIAATAATRVLQEQAVAAEKERFDVGTSTALLVAQAQRDLLASQIAEIRAIVDYRSALVSLYRAEGTLLARRGIVIGSSTSPQGS